MNPAIPLNQSNSWGDIVWRENPRPADAPNTALVRVRDPRALAAVQAGGNELTREFQRTFQAVLGHRKADGQMFTPTITDASIRFHRETGLPHYYVVVVDPETFHHCTMDDVTGARMRLALRATLGREVFVIDNLESVQPGVGRGVVFVVALGNVAPAPDAVVSALPTRLPKIARLDLRERDDLRGKLRVPIGVSAEGEVWRVLPSIKHARFVGMSNSGKTTAIHAALAALLTYNAPAQLRVALIDLKRNEFVFWKGAPHRWGDVARDIDEAEKLLRDIKTETDRRNDLLGAAQRRSIESYNAIAAEPLPYLLVVVDEARDLINQAGTRSAINKLLQSIATGGRSAGVYLWAGTQYAGAAEGLSRVISENLKSFVFRVADATSARVAGCPGAQTIPESAPGRMLARLRDDAEPTLLQGFFLDDDELRALGARVAGQPAATHAAVAFPDKVRVLLCWARDANAGFLAAADIQQHNADAGPRGARRLAEQLERDGLLSKDPKNQNRRRLTEHALDLLNGAGQFAPAQSAG